MDPLRLSASLSVGLPFRRAVFFSFPLPACVSAFPSVCLSVSLCVCLSVSLSLSLCLYFPSVCIFPLRSVFPSCPLSPLPSWSGADPHATAGLMVPLTMRAIPPELMMPW